MTVECRSAVPDLLALDPLEWLTRPILGSVQPADIHGGGFDVPQQSTSPDRKCNEGRVAPSPPSGGSAAAGCQPGDADGKDRRSGGQEPGRQDTRLGGTAGRAGR